MEFILCYIYFIITWNSLLGNRSMSWCVLMKTFQYVHHVFILALTLEEYSKWNLGTCI